MIEIRYCIRLKRFNYDPKDGRKDTLGIIFEFDGGDELSLSVLKEVINPTIMIPFEPITEINRFLNLKGNYLTCICNPFPSLKVKSDFKLSIFSKGEELVGTVLETDLEKNTGYKSLTDLKKSDFKYEVFFISSKDSIKTNGLIFCISHCQLEEANRRG